jgi:hypothetical protein
MVKNTSGGTKTKGLARKHVKSAGGGNAALRLPENALEVIVYVEVMLGNGMCKVFNNTGEEFIAHIRNKFKGRHKRANLITKKSIILCGYREWEKPYKNLDVIFIYDDYNISQLRENPTINITNLITRITNDDYNTTKYDNDFHFTNNDDDQLYLNDYQKQNLNDLDHNDLDHNDLDLDLDLV